MSERETIQSEIVKFLNENDAFNAPFGVLEGKTKLPRGGFVRHVTFGCARTLDAVVYIWSKNKVTVQANGPLEYLFRGVKTPQDFMKALKKIA